MPDRYRIEDSRRLTTPALVVFLELVQENLDRMVAMAGDPARLRPHVKTHKTREVIELQLQRGIAKFKAATFAECEMLARAGARDVLLAYQVVGRNIERAVRFVQMFPEVRFMVIADHPEPVESLSRAMVEAGQKLEVLLDLDTGQHRTGLPVGSRARQVYGQIAESPGLQAGGFHIYDGHLRHPSLAERSAAVKERFREVDGFRRELIAAGWEVPRLVCGGTVTFPVYAGMEDPSVELSPGTCIFHDVGYGSSFPDLPFTPAAVILTRVISLPGENRVTLDLGYKAVASDQPMEKRAVFPQLPDAKLVMQNEEHLVIETSRAGTLHPGDELAAIPWHICPTTALNREVVVVSRGRVKERWEVVARDRCLTV
jgi:D-serine deaminase-like pyridoxal phosphate-dependent protein